VRSSRKSSAPPRLGTQGGALQVTDTKQATIEVRAIMSAKMPGPTFELAAARCARKNGRLLQKEHPEALPLTRQVTILERGGADLEAAQEAVRLAPENGIASQQRGPRRAEQR